MLYLKSLGVWLLLAILAIILGSLRNAFLLPTVGDLTAHQIGTLVFLICQFLIIHFFVKWISKSATRRIAPANLLMIGVFWAVPTVAFEFLFGYYVIGHQWEKLLADYNIFKGRLWILVLLNNIAAPLISGRIIKLRQAIP